MAINDLRDFIKILKKQGELVVVDAPVDPHLEVSEVTDRVSKAHGPALLFKNPIDSRMPILINQFGSMKRMGMALGRRDLDDIAAELGQVLELQVPQGIVAKVKALGRLKELSDSAPRLVKKGPCQEVVMDEPDLDSLPILKTWPGDGGPFITLPVVFTKDPSTGNRNAGMYRLQKFDSRTTGMHWHVHKDAAENFRASGDRMEVAVAIGTDPATTYAATAPLPRGIDEMMLAGFLKGSPVEMVACKTVDMEVPATAEIVLEGFVKKGELRREGPFGDHTGYYSVADDYPIFHLTCVTHRRDPVYATTIVGRPPMEDCFLGKATERLFLPLLRLTLPELVDMNLPLEGVFHNCAILSIRKSYPMHARKMMSAVWGLGMLSLTKFVVIVDEHVNVHDESEVAWRVFNNVDPRRDVVITEGPLDVLDHSSPTPNYGAKMGLDATKAWASEGYPREWPDDIVMSGEIKRLVDMKWSSYGIDLGRDFG
ncbi:MAG: menaquinone biosynthesis decarboxylase [Thermoleophilia bacterium]|nr:menaquinone biosynthesis decarboxylase [Thermoleophilia bacterium]